MVFHVPTTSEHTTVIGKTGSGKTQGGSFLLANAPFDQMPYVILDFKREGLFAEIAEIRELPFDDPKAAISMLSQPGLFIVHPRPDQTDEVDDLLWAIWSHEYCGVFIDEGYMVGKSKAYETVLTQGRSKNIPVITLTQRPSWISRYAFSEAAYFMIFRLTDKRDRDTVQSFVDADISERLPPFYSYWYDVNQEKVVILRPVPDRQIIIETIRRRLQELQEVQKQKKFI
jgi:DNA helicase HerA-like ATPase